MCGICGVAWTDPALAPGEATLATMVSRLEHRGPDDSGTYRDDHAALGFRRLSIVDLPGGHQPLSNEDGTIWTVFNGEIYNFPALRRRLEARGHTLRSTGDTEVLVHLYEDEGPGLFELLRGMFALAIWDAPRRRLILGRDRLGQKPLVYRHAPGKISFASELKSLLALPEAELPRRIDPLSLDRYLTYGYVPHPSTILAGVHKLPPAHYAVWQDGRLELTRYWNPTGRWRSIGQRSRMSRPSARPSTTRFASRWSPTFPLGAFLSGGIDSTIIVGLMQRASNRPVQTFSIGFGDPAFDESRYAELAARSIGTEHQTFVVEPKAWETLPALASQFDEPFADSSALPTWLVARETRNHVTVALTGDAGDELFAGYDRYRAVALAAGLDRLPQGFRNFLGGPLARAWPGSVKAKTRLRQVRRMLEGIGQTPESRYLRWVTMFDEPSRASLYSDDFLGHLAESARDRPDEGRPVERSRSGFRRGAEARPGDEGHDR